MPTVFVIIALSRMVLRILLLILKTVNDWVHPTFGRGAIVCPASLQLNLRRDSFHVSQNTFSHRVFFCQPYMYM